MEHSELNAKEAKLIASLKGLGSVIVAYSGGVDSSLLAHYARAVLKDKARVVIAVSPSLPADELTAAREQALERGWDLLEIKTDEVEAPEYQRNDAMRCYYCKNTLFEKLELLASRLGAAYLAYGANVDDLKDFRPGAQAAARHNVVSPLKDAGLTKEEIRLLAHRAGLPSWDRPQAACLSSRFQTHDPISALKLAQVESAERCLHVLGFRQVRVRHHGDLARIELAADEISLLAEDRDMSATVCAQLKALGYKYVVLDLEGYRQGSANKLKQLESLWTAIS